MTAYTPYQPEISQGTLQSIFEFQSLIAELIGLPVVSASHYDGATATAEAALMTVRATGRSRVLISRAVHRHFIDATRTYFGPGVRTVEELPTTDEGTTDLAALRDGPGRPGGPCRGGHPRPAQRVRAARADGRGGGARPRGRRAVRRGRRADVSLAVLATPGEYGADIAAGEGQPLGIAPQYGGPSFGLLACTDALIRQIPGRLVGQTTDLEGRRACVMTLRAREQDIRRDKAASNICTNQALCALAATVVPRHARAAWAARRRRLRCGERAAARARPCRRRRAARPQRRVPQ